MGQLDLLFNDAVETLKTVKSGAVATVIAAANVSRDSTVWPKSKVDGPALDSAVAALNDAAMSRDQRKAAEIVIGAAMESRPMTDMSRTLA